MTSQLPTYTDDVLRESAVADLMRLIARDEDRVPRNLIDECARRGDAMLDAIKGLLDKDYYWGEDQSDGEWWRLLHAVMILGLMESHRAGELLVRFMRRMDEAGDEALEESLSGYWPALFRNKPESVLPTLQALGEDRELSWYIRGDAVNSGIAWIQAHASDKLDQAIDRAARIAFGKDEAQELRVMLGATLLSFPRAKDRRALEKLAELQSDEARWFGREDIIRTYAAGAERPDWEDFADPWKFYEPQIIEERQRFAAEELVEDDEEDFIDEPFVRDAPKVGRNDPCPCGSGKKYKKCCMVQ
jgi:uncharacterized protein YchJ